MESKEQTAVQVAESNSTPTINNSSWLNFNVIHIIIEVAALCGVAVYFSNKISVLTKQVEDLNHRLEEQEETIQKHEEILKKLIAIRQQQVASYRSASPIPISTPSNASSSCVGGVCTLPTSEKNVVQQPRLQSDPRLEEAAKSDPRLREVFKPTAMVAIVASASDVQKNDSPLPTITEVTEENLDEELKDELSELKEQ